MTDTSARGSVLLAACYTPKCGRRERTAMLEEIHNEFYDEGNTENLKNFYQLQGANNDYYYDQKQFSYSNLQNPH